MSDAELGRNMAKLSNAERLARAVLLFHSGTSWDQYSQMIWFALTGEVEATTRVLCNLARRVRNEEEKENNDVQ